MITAYPLITRDNPDNMRYQLIRKLYYDSDYMTLNTQKRRHGMKIKRRNKKYNSGRGCTNKDKRCARKTSNYKTSHSLSQIFDKICI